MRSRLQALALAASMTVACGRATTHVPGTNRDLSIQVVFADRNALHLSTLAWFSLVLSVGGESYTYALNYDAGSSTLSFVPAAPTDLPVEGIVTATLQAYDYGGQPVVTDGAYVGGRSNPVDLAAADAAGTVKLPIVIGKLGGFVPLGVDLSRARFLHTATAVGPTALLVVGGAGLGTPLAATGFVDLIEWLDRFAHQHCTATSGGVASGDCGAWGTVPPPRVDHVALALATGFGPACPHRDAILVALGRDEAGAALGDAYLFEAAGFASGGAFTKLSLALTPRAGATAYATRDCRVVLAAGHGSGDLTPIADAEVLSFAPGGVTIAGRVTLPRPTVHAMAFRLDNGIDEVIVAGGEDASGAAVKSAMSLPNNVASLVAYDLDADPPTYNGARATMRCARLGPVAARLQVGGILASTLIVGDGSPACAGGGAEMFRASSSPVELPYDGFVDVSAAIHTPRFVGHGVAALPDGSALIFGGHTSADVASPPTKAAERFVLSAQFSAAAAAAGGDFSEQGALSGPRAFQATAVRGVWVWAVGGFTGTEATAQVEIYTLGL
ncbi:MAG: hypothetical protein HY903_16380 [Deltaproteobacteria bacterium]|nr:hypothetical protein [Deltaproteobacteria bacterium]